jgi:hypothetical protein
LLVLPLGLPFGFNFSWGVGARRVFHGEQMKRRLSRSIVAQVRPSRNLHPSDL